jgi:type I restriction enzyme, R subunit
VQQNTRTSGIGALTTIQQLNAEMLDAIASQDVPDTVKVFNLVKAIHQLATVNAGQEPYLVSIGDKAEQIAGAFEGRQQTTEQTLRSLLELTEQVKKARQERDATKLLPESFAVYWLLKHDGIEQADSVARQAEQAFEAYPHWRSSTHQEQELRRSFYKALITAGVDGVVDVAERILNMLRRAQHES